MPPRVDVIIAARNEAARLGDCLASLRAQDYPSEVVRIIVVDNGSSDATPDVVARHGVSLLREDRRGAAAARNRALSESDGDFVAVLDAHCVVNRTWLRALTACFADPRIGGCQARIENRATSQRLQRYMARSGTYANARILEDTILGERNVLPWVLSGNSMYRREALREAGGFDESLIACEDVDLAWRMVLLGYHLAYSDNAVAVHSSDDTWWEHVRKASRYGGASAVLARRYLPHGARQSFKPADLWSRDFDRTAHALSYWLGYRTQALRLALRLSKPANPPISSSVQPRFRVPFDWRDGIVMQISEETVFWSRRDTSSVLVHLPSRVRAVLEGAGHLIWKHLARGASREATVRALAAHYAISPTTARADLDALVEELVDAELVRIGSSKPASGPRA